MKICEVCKKQSKEVRIDLDEEKTKRKWKCNKCYFSSKT